MIKPLYELSLSTVLGAASAVALAGATWAAQVAPSGDEVVAPQATEQAAQAADPNALRICAAANEEPFSSSTNAGFENRIASAVAEELDAVDHLRLEIRVGERIALKDSVLPEGAELSVVAEDDRLEEAQLLGGRDETARELGRQLTRGRADLPRGARLTS